MEVVPNLCIKLEVNYLCRRVLRWAWNKSQGTHLLILQNCPGVVPCITRDLQMETISRCLIAQTSWNVQYGMQVALVGAYLSLSPRSCLEK